MTGCAGDLECKKDLTLQVSVATTWEQVMEHICLQHIQSRDAGTLSTTEPLASARYFGRGKLSQKESHLTDLSVFCSLVGMNHTRG